MTCWECPFCSTALHVESDYPNEFDDLDEDEIECLPKMQRACNDCAAARVDQVLELLTHHSDVEHIFKDHADDLPKYYKNLVEGLKQILGE